MTSIMRCEMTSPSTGSASRSLTDRQNAVVSNWRAVLFAQTPAAHIENRQFIQLPDGCTMAGDDLIGVNFEFRLGINFSACG